MSKRWRRRIAVALASLAITLLFARAALELELRRADIVDPSFVYENRLEMWTRDDALGYVNKAGFRAACFGTVLVHTDADGFRADPHESGSGNEGERTLVGIGDSVTWGTSVNAEDSFLGVLRRRLPTETPVRILNAGVVGYSTVQELLLLERRVLPLAPDFVLVNLCRNDFLPTEDPFGNARDVYLAYLRRISEDESWGWSEQERRRLGELAERIRSVPELWQVMAANSRVDVAFCRKVLLEIPLRLMSAACRAHDARFLVLLIPPQVGLEPYRATVEPMMQSLSAHGVEFLDLCDALATDESEVVAGLPRTWRPRPWPFLREIDLIARARRVGELQDENKFIDDVHPSRRGNVIIAERILEHLTSTPGWR